METEQPHATPAEFGALLEEALGHGPAEAAGRGSLPPSDETTEASEDLPSSLFVGVGARTSSPNGVLRTAGTATASPPNRPAPAPEGPLPSGPGSTVESATPPGGGDVAVPGDRAAPGEETGPVDPVMGLTAPPTTVDGHIQLHAEWADRPLLRQPLLLKPGASVGTPGSGACIANPATIPVTYVPPGSGDDPTAGTYFVDPAEVAAAVGPGGLVTDELMAQLSGHPYQAGPPTAVQLAIIEAARRAGLRFPTPS